MAPSRLFPCNLAVTSWLILLDRLCCGHIIVLVLKSVSSASVSGLTTSSVCQEKVNKSLVVLLFKQLDTTASFLYTGSSRGDIRPLLPAAFGHSEGPRVDSNRSVKTTADSCPHRYRWGAVRRMFSWSRILFMMDLVSLSNC